MKYMEHKSLDNMTFINRVVVKRNYLALLNLPFELKLLFNYCYLNLLNYNLHINIVI